jgi:hypothetical protein
MRFIGLASGQRVEAVDADLSTITSEADKVFRVRGRNPWLLNRLERLTERLLDVSSWEELLAEPTRRRRNGSRQKSS